jgi:hypothetical protein
MINLWVSGEGWKAFKRTDTAELENRGIYIGDRVYLGDGVYLGNRVHLGNGVHLGDGGWLGDGVHLGDRCRLGDFGCLGDGAKPICVNITGSQFPVSYWGEDRIDIGCKSRSIDEWLTDSTDLAKEYNFTLEAAAEYRGYVEFIKSIHLGQTSVNQTA